MHRNKYSLYERLFIEQMTYGIGVRNIVKDEKLPFEQGSEEKKKICYDILKPGLFRWFADPFPVENGEEKFIFFELMENHKCKGAIGIVRWSPKIGFGKVEKVLEESFHLSFPNVFQYNGHWYMIPESVDVRQLRLYEAADFPYGWKLKKVLASDLDIYDTCMTWMDKNTLLLIGTYGKRIIKSWKLDMRLLEIELMDWLKPEVVRAGGNILSKGGTQYRVLQDCRECYGKKVLFQEIDQLDVSEKVYKEHYVGELTIEDVTYLGDNGKASRVHTFNRSESLETVDFFFKKFNPLKMLYKVVAHYVYGKY